MRRRIDYHVYFEDDKIEDKVDKFMDELTKSGVQVFSEEKELANWNT